MPSKSKWSIRLLGGISVCNGDAVLSKFRNTKDIELLALLALVSGRQLAREELIEQLWPDIDPSISRNRLRYTLCTLKAQLCTIDAESGPPIGGDRHTVWLESDRVLTDVQELESACRAAADADTVEVCRAILSPVAHCCSAELLPGFYSEFILRERGRLRDHYVTSLRRLFTLLVDEGSHAEAVEIGMMLISDAPTDIRAHCLLMKSYADLGEPYLVRRQILFLQDIWKKEFGESIAPDLQCFADRMIQDAVSRAMHPV